ncbi:MAG: ATP-binding protein [Caldilineaceae bacterium]
MRTLLFELRPIILQSRGLIAALQSYHEQLSKTLTAQVHLEVEELPFKLKDTVAGNIFTILQESINNIRKHADAQNIWLRVYTDEEYLYFECEDDGKGFDVSTIRRNYDDRGSFGLLNMYERAEMLNGKLNIASPSPRISRGSIIRGQIPIEDAKQD